MKWFFIVYLLGGVHKEYYGPYVTQDECETGRKNVHHIGKPEDIEIGKCFTMQGGRDDSAWRYSEGQHNGV